MYENQEIEKIKELAQKVSVLEKQLDIAKDALNDIIRWNDELNEEYQDEGERAHVALTNIDIVDGF